MDRAHIAVTVAIIAFLASIARSPNVDSTESFSPVFGTSLQSFPSQRLRSINFENNILRTTLWLILDQKLCSNLFTSFSIIVWTWMFCDKFKLTKRTFKV